MSGLTANNQIQDDEIIDLVDVSLIFAAISAASEAINQFQSWRLARAQAQIDSARPSSETFSELRRDLLHLADLVAGARVALGTISASIDECVSLISNADADLLSQIPFITGYKAGVRLRDRGRYRDALDSVFSNLRLMLRSLDESSELISRIVPPTSREELLNSARISVIEHQAVSDSLRALADGSTTFSDAVAIARALISNANEFLKTIHDEAFEIAG